MFSKATNQLKTIVHYGYIRGAFSIFCPFALRQEIQQGPSYNALHLIKLVSLMLCTKF